MDGTSKRGVMTSLYGLNVDVSPFPESMYDRYFGDIVIHYIFHISFKFTNTNDSKNRSRVFYANIRFLYMFA